MTPRPEDVALRIVRAFAEVAPHDSTEETFADRDAISARYRELRIVHPEGFGGASRVARVEFIARLIEECAASRLEGEGRDGARLDWLEARAVSSIYFALGGQFNPGIVRLRPAIDAAMQSPAAASSPQPTTTTEEHEP